MIGRAVTRNFRLVGALVFALALVCVHAAKGTPIVLYSSVVHVRSDPSAGSGTAAPVGTVGVLDGTSQVYVKVGTGSTAWTRVDVNAAGGVSITIDTTGTPGNFNFSTLGTVDWLYIGQWTQSRDLWHSKQTGGWLERSLRPIQPTSGATDSRTWQINSTQSDDTLTTSFYSAATSVPLNGFNGTGALNSGARWAFPTSPTTRHMRWEGTMYDATTTIVVTSYCDGNTYTQSALLSTPVGAGLDYLVQVTFSGPSGCEITVTHTITSILVSTANLYFGPLAVN